MEVAKVNADLQIDFPSKVKEWLQAESELALFLEGDTLILKKITLPKLSSLAERKSGVEMPLEEICEEVHQYRREKKASRKS